MKTHPVTNNGHTDTRYQIAKELHRLGYSLDIHMCATRADYLERVKQLAR